MGALLLMPRMREVEHPRDSYDGERAPCYGCRDLCAGVVADGAALDSGDHRWFLHSFHASISMTIPAQINGTVSIVKQNTP